MSETVLFRKREAESLNGRSSSGNGPQCGNGAPPGALIDHAFFALVAWPAYVFTPLARSRKLAQATGQPEPTLRQSDSPLLLLLVFPLEDRGVDLFEPVGDDAR